MASLITIAVIAIAGVSWAQSGAESALDALIGQVADLRAEHTQLMDAFGDEQRTFSGLIDDVESLRRARTEAGELAGSDALQSALRDANSAAANLSARSDELRALADRIAALESELVARITEQIAALEQGIGGVSPDELDAVVARLSSLSALRATYQRPVPEAPVVQMDAILYGMQMDVSVEELEATADELADNERRIQEFLEELDAHIREMEQQEQLRRRTGLARSDASLFEEGVNSGRRESSGRSTQTGSTARSQAGDGNETASPADPAVNVDGAGAERATVENDSDGASGGGSANDTQTADTAPAPGFSEGSEPEAPMGVGGDDGGGDTLSGSSDPTDEVEGGATFDGPEPTLGTPTFDGINLGAPIDEHLQLNVDSEVVEEEEVGGSRLDQLRRQRQRANLTLEEIRRQRQQVLERANELEESGEW